MKELYKALKKAKIDYNIVHNLDILKSLFNSAVGNSIQEDMLKKAKEYADLQGGECLSTEYINNRTNLEWKCKNIKHFSWFANYNSVVNCQTWCAECDGNKKLNGLILAQEYATSKNGKCLSDEYVNTKIKLKWKCINNEHPVFHKSFEHAVRRGQWCLDCYKESKNIK